NLEHPARPAGIDRHALLRTHYRLRPGLVTQLELAALQGDRLRHGEDVLVEGDRLVPPGRIRQGDRLAQIDLTADRHVGGVVHDDRGRDPAVLQRLQQRPEAGRLLADGAGRAGEQATDPGGGIHDKSPPKAEWSAVHWEDNEPGAQTVRPGAVGPVRR